MSDQTRRSGGYRPASYAFSPIISGQNTGRFMIEYRPTLDNATPLTTKLYITAADPKQARYICDKLDQGLTQEEIYMSLLPKTGKAWILKKRQGCSCCGAEYEYSLPYLDQDDAEKKLKERTEYNRVYGRESITFSLIEVSYEISGRFMILNGRYAAHAIAEWELDGGWGDLEKFQE